MTIASHIFLATLRLMNAFESRVPLPHNLLNPKIKSRAHVFCNLRYHPPLYLIIHLKTNRPSPKLVRESMLVVDYSIMLPCIFM